MKIIKKLSLLFVVLLVSTTACEDEFLEKAPLDRGSVEGFFETQEDVLRAVNGIYDVFQGVKFVILGAFSHNYRERGTTLLMPICFLKLQCFGSSICSKRNFLVKKGKI